VESRSTSKLLWEWRQAICTLSSRNNVAVFWDLGRLAVQGNDDGDAVDTKVSSNPILGPEPAIPISPRVGRLKIKEQLVRKHSVYLVTTSRIRQSKLFIEGPSEKLFRELMALDRKECRRITGLLNIHCALRWHLRTMGLSDNAIVMTCSQEAGSSYHRIYNFPILIGHRMKIFGSAFSQQILVRTSTKQVLALALRIGLL
jgi:hypothetical protein